MFELWKICLVLVLKDEMKNQLTTLITMERFCSTFAPDWFISVEFPSERVSILFSSLVYARCTCIEYAEVKWLHFVAIMIYYSAEHEISRIWIKWKKREINIKACNGERRRTWLLRTSAVIQFNTDGHSVMFIHKLRARI